MKFKRREQKEEILSNYDKLWETLKIDNCRTEIDQKAITLTFDVNIGDRRVQVNSPTYATMRPLYFFEGRQDDAVQFLYYTVFENQEIKKFFEEEKFVRFLANEFREHLDRLMMEQAKGKIKEKFDIISVREGELEENRNYLLFSLREQNGRTSEIGYVPRNNGGYLKFFHTEEGEIDWLKFLKVEEDESLELNFPVALKSNKKLFLNQVMHEFVFEEYCKTEEYQLKNLFQH